MKIIFVENRYATRIYIAVAPALQAAGHEVHWMVQNPIFSPSGASVYHLRFPSPADLQGSSADPIYERLAQSDRALRYFGGNNRHYAHYHRLICAVLDRVQPDVVFGESTQLHELLTIEECRRRGIRYLFPTSTRYPPSRLCFLHENTMEPVGGCGVPMSDVDATDMIQRINQRNLVPSYMTETARPELTRRARALSDRLRIVWSWARGERYLTPAPVTKLRVDRQHKRSRMRWATLASARYGNLEGSFVLYPLQMQPESTIDVWGLPWNDQAEIVLRSAKALAPLGMRLFVKPNPKPKYEIDDRLCSAAESCENLVPVPEGVPMSILFDRASAVLSVTGTVLIESVLAGKPAFTLGEHAMARYPGVAALREPEELSKRLVQEALRIDTSAAAVALLQQLHRSSYAVRMPDPLYQVEELVGALRADLERAFGHVLTVVDRHDREIGSAL